MRAVTDLTLTVCVLLAAAGCRWVGPAKPESPDGLASAPLCRCCKVPDGSIRIDGKLDEPAWKGKQKLVFLDIVSGAKPAHPASARVAWDSSYLYIGVEVVDPNVWARWGLVDSEEEKQKKSFYSDFDPAKERGQGRAETRIMACDPFVKIFIDPDADGLMYLEFHVSPLNNVYDTYVEYGAVETPDGLTRRGDLHIEWNCEGFLSAVHVDGTLNNPHDRDEGWSVEAAIPWEALRRFTKKQCPPAVGDVWKLHLGRVERKEYRSDRIYWTWPVIGKVDCHIPARHGDMVFCDSPGR